MTEIERLREEMARLQVRLAKFEDATTDFSTISSGTINDISSLLKVVAEDILSIRNRLENLEINEALRQ